MKEKLMQVWQKAASSFAGMSKRVRGLLIGTLVIIIVGVIAAVWVLSSKPYSVLFTGLAADDMSSVLSYLEESGVADYRVRENDTILVPENQEASLKAKLLMQGYPSSGFGYSMYLDNVNALSTETDRKNLHLLDLQDRLGAVVRCFEGVEDAVVTIAQGEDRRYVLDSGNVIEASASVLITMKSAKSLTNEQALAIRSLIARAVQGLEISNISISDTAGKTYSGGEDAASSDASQLKLALEEQVNNTVRNNIMQVLTPLFGLQNLSVSVNSTVDVSRSRQETTAYTEPEWAADGSTGGKGIIGSRVYDYNISRDGNAPAGGVVGTETNSDLTTYVESGYQPDGTEGQIQASGQQDYLVDNSKTQTERAAGTITDLMVSVSINSTSTGMVGTESLMRHVARAAGIGSDLETEKISILSVPFYTEAPAPVGPIADALNIPDWAINALIAGAALFVVLLMIILMIRKRSKRKKVSMQPAYAFEGAVQQMEPMGADIMDLRTERSLELRKDVRSFAENNPEIAAQMVKSWLRGGEDGNG